MSRRHHGRPHHHAPGGADRPRHTATSQAPGPTGTPFEGVPPVPAAGTHLRGAGPSLDIDGTPRNSAPMDGAAAYTNGASSARSAPINGHAANGGARTETNGAHSNGAPVNGAPVNGDAVNVGGGQCTAPQLRRFIKSRPYVPMHELRRRFGIVGDDDDVTPVRMELGWVYVGLPSREGGLLGELLRAGEIGYELSLDPRTPIVIGVYPMRPIPRN